MGFFSFALSLETKNKYTEKYIDPERERERETFSKKETTRVEKIATESISFGLSLEYTQ